MSLVPIGYFPKERLDRTKASFLSFEQDIGSVSECIVPGPKEWEGQWKHNDFWCFNSEELALQVVPPDNRQSFSLYAYEVSTAIFDIEGKHTLAIPDMNISRRGSGYDELGYDIVQINSLMAKKTDQPAYCFECSPLTCNSLMKKVVVNQHCLLNSEEEALTLAERVAKSNGTLGEPGAYVVVRVFRKRA